LYKAGFPGPFFRLIFPFAISVAAAHRAALRGQCADAPIRGRETKSETKCELTAKVVNASIAKQHKAMILSEIGSMNS
jgi:hypothetical protein